MLAFRQFYNPGTVKHFSVSLPQCHRFTDQNNATKIDSAFPEIEGAPKESFLIFAEHRSCTNKNVFSQLGSDLTEVDTTGLGMGEPHSTRQIGVIPSVQERFAIDKILNPRYLDQQIRAARVPHNGRDTHGNGSNRELLEKK